MPKNKRDGKKQQQRTNTTPDTTNTNTGPPPGSGGGGGQPRRIPPNKKRSRDDAALRTPDIEKTDVKRQERDRPDAAPVIVIPRRRKLGTNAQANTKFTRLQDKPRQHAITKNTYLTELANSVEENRPISYVVNAILPWEEAHLVRQVVLAIMAGTKGMDDRVAFVFGINGNVDKAAELDDAWNKAATAVADFGLPIAVLKIPFRGAFKHGTMRNEVLTSVATAEATAGLYGTGSHPYISIQDFDAAARTVPSGEHIFTYFADKLEGKNPLNPDDNFAIRPLMMAGGYRPGSITKFANVTTMAHGMTNAEFALHISEDMQTREELAKIHPLLPYSPEPNLYIDATLLLAGAEDIQFGSEKAEFGQLSDGLNRRYASELTELAPKQRTPNIPAPTRTETQDDDLDMEVSPTVTTETEPVYADEDFIDESSQAFHGQDEIELRAHIKGMAENFRHPVRGIAYLTDFVDGAIETDLTRIAAKMDEKWSKQARVYTTNKVPQSHVPPKNAADRMFTIRDAAKGTSMVEYGRSERTSEPMGIKEEIPKKTSKQKIVVVPPPNWDYQPLPVVNKYGMRPIDFTGQVWRPPEDDLQTYLAVNPWYGDGKNKGATTQAHTRLSEATSAELSTPYARIFAGIRPSQTAIALHDVALSNPTRSTMYGLQLLQDQLLPQTVTDAKGNNPMEGMPVALGSPVYAVAHATNTTSHHLRGKVIDAAIAMLKAEDEDNVLARQPITTFIVQHGLSRGDVAAALAQTQNWTAPVNILPGDAERTQHARDFALRLIATHLNRPIEIALAGGRSVEYQPFHGTKSSWDGPARIKLTVTDRDGTPTMTFSRNIT